MDYKAKECVTCGSDKIKLISHKNDGENIFYKYRCEACGEEFSTESKYLEQQKRLKRQTEKELAKQTKEATLKTETEIKAECINNKHFSAAEIFKEDRKFVVEIQADFGFENSCGTGIIIGNGYILSNAHVVTDKTRKRGVTYLSNDITCLDAAQKGYELEIVFADIKKDLVLLYSDELSCDGAIFCNGDIITGEKVFAIGNSKGQGICILDGIVSDNERTIGGDKFIMYSAPTVQGNSGGPIFNDSGEVIGITTLGRTDASAMNYAIPISTVKTFIEQAKSNKQIDVKLNF